MSEFYVQVGDSAEFSKTVGESDVYLFAGITGDLAPNHVNEEYMRKSSYKGRIAHGALMVGYMSAASTMITQRCAQSDEETAVSLGYDRVRFLGPVFIGDTITVAYKITDVDVDMRRSIGKIEITNQDGTLVTVGKHILKWVKNT